jgi:hypothetical protein
MEQEGRRMNEQDFYWIKKCRTNKDDFFITVDNDCAFVTDLRSFDRVHEFEHFGWRLALDLFLCIGCNAG